MQRFILIVLMVFAMISQCQAAVISLTANSLGLKSGNYGAVLIVEDFLNITAITKIGRSSGPEAGTIYVAAGDIGLGVQSVKKRGSEGINGSGSYSDEAIVFSFLSGVPVSSIQLGLSDYSKCSDNPVIELLFLSGDKALFSKLSSGWNEAISSIGGGKVLVDIGTLFGTSSNKVLSQLTVTELCGEVYVNSIVWNSTSVPEPATIMLLGLGCVMVLPLKRK